ncbi:MAG: phosphoglucosamine mutase [Acidimicrobiia bacterium]|nr:MAG: phosphoglucosamine mutase [Acidimicrobiia bacterium]
MAENRLFGTDGVRGLANVEITPELAVGLTRAAAAGRSGTVVVGRDTRRSGQMLIAAVVAGCNSAGLDAVDLGIVPVGAVSHHTIERRATLGVMVSASHNPAADNGIKFFGSDGAKLASEEEAAIEARFRSSESGGRLSGEEIGVQLPDPAAVDEYIDHLASLSQYRLSGIKVTLDCANGAAFLAAPRLFSHLGAETEALFVAPSGMNINDGCGAVSPGVLASRVAGGVGLAFDGDADRCIAVDEDGQVCDGDVIMAIIARHLKENQALPGDRLVATVMSNLGFRTAMSSLSVAVEETPVGDRYVLEAMRRTGAALGGEQSGHVLFGGRATGDGLLTGLRLLEVMAATGRPLRELRRVMTAFPQVLRNVRVRVKERLGDAEAIWEAVRRVEKRLGDEGRVLVRSSGTEPLVRVMVEARAPHEAASAADDIAAVVRRELGATSDDEG